MNEPRTFDTWITTYCGISSADPGYGIAYVAWKASERAQADVIADYQKRLSLAQERITELRVDNVRLLDILASVADRAEKML